MAETIDLTGDGGVIKTIVKRAKPDAIAPSDSLPLVDVHYEGTLAETGEVFDTTHEDNTIFSFEVGKGSVIKAWDVALRTMKVGEVAKITCKSDYAYGSAGSPPEIPPDATLIFEVELLACRPRKGSSVASASDERARLDLAWIRAAAAALASSRFFFSSSFSTQKEEEKKKREEAKAAAAARIQAKLDSKKGPGKGKGKGKSTANLMSVQEVNSLSYSEVQDRVNVYRPVPYSLSIKFSNVQCKLLVVVTSVSL
nr:peptidyl-prolyl cis-trans isomerase FKBP20-1 [Tanacetum cinerariifolium]